MTDDNDQRTWIRLEECRHLTDIHGGEESAGQAAPSLPKTKYDGCVRDRTLHQAAPAQSLRYARH